MGSLRYSMLTQRITQFDTFGMCCDMALEAAMHSMQVARAMFRTHNVEYTNIMSAQIDLFYTAVTLASCNACLWHLLLTEPS